MAKKPLASDDPAESVESLKQWGTRKFLHYSIEHSVAMLVGLLIGVGGVLALSFTNTPVRDLFVAMHVKSYEAKLKEYEARSVASETISGQLRADRDELRVANEKLTAANHDLAAMRQEEERRAKGKEEAEARASTYWEPRLLPAVDIQLEPGSEHLPWEAVWALPKLSDGDVDRISTVTYRFGSMQNWQNGIWETHTTGDRPSFAIGIPIGRLRSLERGRCPYFGDERATITIRLKTGETVTSGLFPPCQAFHP